MQPLIVPKLTASTRALTGAGLIRFVRAHKRPLAGVVTLAFFGFIGFYLASHPAVIQSLLHIGYASTALILAGYSGVLLTNVGIMDATIRLCNKKLTLPSGLRLMIYSSVVNFFGPLQSGPGVRAGYLKATTGLRIRDFTAARGRY